MTYQFTYHFLDQLFYETNGFVFVLVLTAILIGLFTKHIAKE